MGSIIYDLCIIGGGINGAGIARDAAGRGLSVVLVEAQDLASGTSSMSTKLIHGGLRYLEYYDFKLVRESLKEREVLMGIAPHVVSPIEFVLPHNKSQRPYFAIRAGLFLYDNLAKRQKLKASKGVKFKGSHYGGALDDRFEKGFVYSDCRVDDSRLVVLNAIDAAALSAKIMTYTKCVGLKREEDLWRINLAEAAGGKLSSISARMVVNAAGPWVSEIVDQAGFDDVNIPKTRLVKGSHIITNRLYDGDQSYIIQLSDGRIVFVIPYEKDFTLIGTTEDKFDGSPYDAHISDVEMDYLCDAYNQNFKGSIFPKDVVWAYSGVRPLFDDGAKQAHKVSRDHKIYVHEAGDNACLSVFGGKLTTYRVVAEEVVDKLVEFNEVVHGADNEKSWTAVQPLPGGDIAEADFDAFVEAQKSRYSFLPNNLLKRYAHAYGTRMERFLDGAYELGDLGKCYGGDLYEAEVMYLLRYEFARTSEDIIWRRSKLGMQVSDEVRDELEKSLPKLLKKIKKL